MRANKSVIFLTVLLILATTLLYPERMITVTEGAETTTTPNPTFINVSVHDPKITRGDDGRYWVFGSHLASAYSRDLIKWYQWTVDTTFPSDNSLVPNIVNEFSEAIEWGNSKSTWATCVTKIGDKYHMYFSSSSWGSPRSAIGLAISDSIDGPYKYKGLVVKSGMDGESEEKGVKYDNNFHPNCIDPQVFFDQENNLWMVYGSYFAGIFMLKLDPETGFPYPDQGYGERIMGGNHAPMEGANILYSPGTDYYYLFASFGSLGPQDGYNIRVARSKTPTGPYVDPHGNDMRYAQGNRANLDRYGGKLVGNFRFLDANGRRTGIAYVSPGHNSAYFDPQTNNHYLVFHTRFPGRGDMHQVRVHKMLINDDGWPVVLPHRYAGEQPRSLTSDDIVGQYAYINHGRDTSAHIKDSEVIQLNSDGTITGAIAGQWALTGDYSIELTIDSITYSGVAVEQWDDGLKQWVMTFSALSTTNGTSVWGSKLD